MKEVIEKDGIVYISKVCKHGTGTHTCFLTKSQYEEAEKYGWVDVRIDDRPHRNVPRVELNIQFNKKAREIFGITATSYARFFLKLPKGSPLDANHKNRDTKNNLPENLEALLKKDNNRHTLRRTNTGYSHVYYRKDRHSYVVSIKQRNPVTKKLEYIENVSRKSLVEACIKSNELVYKYTPDSCKPYYQFIDISKVVEPPKGEDGHPIFNIEENQTKLTMQGGSLAAVENTLTTSEALL